MGDICKDLVDDGTPATLYSNIIAATDAPNLSLQLSWTQIVATYGSVVSLLASNNPKARQDDEVDWDEMTSDHGFAGFVGLTAGALATSGTAWADLGNANALLYKLKFVRSGGSAGLKCNVAQKRSR